MSGRQEITLAGRKTNVHLMPLSVTDQITLAPATHKGVCIAIPGVEAGMGFDYAGQHFTILKAWDEAAEALPEVGVKHAKQPMHELDIAYYKSRVGKFIDLLLVEGAE